MYIKRIKIKNIRAISDFEMTFDEPAGWHVLIGDNGSGQSVCGTERKEQPQEK